MIEIVKALVGSQAHGLATPESDFDYRGVFVESTEDLLSLNGTTRQTQWQEGRQDDVSWEIGHFLHLATKCNPTIMEVFHSPHIDFKGPYAYDLLELFPHVWNSKGVRDAFCGYGINQRKKFLDERGPRKDKYAVAYLRTLYNAWELLSTHDFSVCVTGTEIEDTCRRWRRGEYEIGEVIQLTREWENKVNTAYEANPSKETNMEAINRFLLQVRRAYWRIEEKDNQHIYAVYQVK